jgi:hypothetical protein
MINALTFNKILRRPDHRLARLDEPEFIMLLDGGIDDRWRPYMLPFKKYKTKITFSIYIAMEEGASS